MTVAGTYLVCSRLSEKFDRLWQAHGYVYVVHEFGIIMVSQKQVVNVLYIKPGQTTEKKAIAVVTIMLRYYRMALQSSLLSSLNCQLGDYRTNKQTDRQTDEPKNNVLLVSNIGRKEKQANSEVCDHEGGSGERDGNHVKQRSVK